MTLGGVALDYGTRYLLRHSAVPYEHTRRRHWEASHEKACLFAGRPKMKRGTLIQSIGRFDGRTSSCTPFPLTGGTVDRAAASPAWVACSLNPGTNSPSTLLTCVPAAARSAPFIPPQTSEGFSLRSNPGPLAGVRSSEPLKWGGWCPRSVVSWTSATAAPAKPSRTISSTLHTMPATTAETGLVARGLSTRIESRDA